jgi:hypothetical protein
MLNPPNSLDQIRQAVTGVSLVAGRSTNLDTLKANTSICSYSSYCDNLVVGIKFTCFNLSNLNQVKQVATTVIKNVHPNPLQIKPVVLLETGVSFVIGVTLVKLQR